MSRWTLLVLAAGAMVLGGCASSARQAALSYYDRPEFTKPTVSLEKVGLGPSSAPVTEADIEAALQQTAALKLPLKLAFYEVAGETAAFTGVVPAQRLRQLPPEDRERWQKKLIDSNLISSVQEVAGILLPTRFDLNRLRLAAARLGCDVLLVYATNSDMHYYRNALWVTYLLIVPIWIVPGNHVDCFTGLSGAVVDVRTRKVLAGFSTVGEGHQVIPYGLEERGERKSAIKARIQALDLMADKLIAFAKAIK